MTDRIAIAVNIEILFRLGCIKPAQGAHEALQESFIVISIAYAGYNFNPVAGGKTDRFLYDGMAHQSRKGNIQIRAGIPQPFPEFERRCLIIHADNE
jgi:hypothetical protein